MLRKSLKCALIFCSVFDIVAVYAADMSTKRCATRLSITLTGESPSEQISASDDPKSMVDQLLGSSDFIENFSRFANAKKNDDPGENSKEDASYHMIKYALTKDLKWSDVFLGGYNLPNPGDEKDDPRVVVSGEGLGYFRSPAWLERYAGDEPEGIRIVTAYRMMQNTIGLSLQATVNAPDADISASGRQEAGCKECHYDKWYALDTNATIFPQVKRNGDGEFQGFETPSNTPQAVLDGKSASNDADFLQLLVDSTDFSYNACRLAFAFVVGREETSCEGAEMAACIDAFGATGRIQDAIKTFVSSDNFCK